LVLLALAVGADAATDAFGVGEGFAAAPAAAGGNQLSLQLFGYLWLAM
jgi:hypothetical protein